MKNLRVEDPLEILGLNDKEVQERIDKGQVNILPKTPSRTIAQIVKANVFTLFNGLNLILAIVVCIAGSPKNALFSMVIFTNTVIGIFQEVRSKITLEKLSVLSCIGATVMRNGISVKLNIEDVVKDDIILLESGDQIVADGVVIGEDEFEVDESLLTGESEPILKKKGDKILSGSFVVAGKGYFKVTNVGSNTYVAKLASEAKKFKTINSEMQDAINKIIKVIIWLIIPVGTLLMGTQIIFSGKKWDEAAIAAVAGIIGMVPEGLVLLTSVTFMVGVITLSKYKTVVQELPATEVLARVNVLCLDKTGTLTEGILEVTDIRMLSNFNIDNVMSTLAHAFPSNNPTQVALMNKYPKNSNIEVKKVIPFSSSRKWSGASLKGMGSWIIGAPEMVLKERYHYIKDKVEEEAKKGRRVLVLAHFKEENITEKLPNNIEAMALITLEDIIREEAPSTLKYFEHQGVEIKVISGDNPVTVAAVAKRVGVKNSDKYIDARKLPNDIEELAAIVKEYSVFGRVTPHQKKNLVKALQYNNNTVAMTGDGVNDVLALKEADCGIAMASGSDATRSVAQLVLLNSNFSALPKVVEEGRKMINNLERVSNLYLSKAFFSLIMSIIFCIIVLPYPFEPIQLTLIGSITIGIPSFFLAISPNKEVVKKGFLRRILNISLPNALIFALFTVGTYLFAIFSGLGVMESRTIAVMIAGGIGLIILIDVSRPFNGFKAILFLSMLIAFVGAFILPITQKIFNLKMVPFIFIVISVAIIILAAVVMPILQVIFSKLLDRLDKK
ncbi:HAD-IC family P-type ATPase [Clostridium bornimense]|uniref:HAD-IC family P-type ATPase n=1 Tax=Clostridium bornimense TaxID=1216932 RepID=UPI001C123726|nr:HAD-IC family P-type ATPase [Clostridium bornimense]MBU5316583.1 HAD-IC family P-type ATPase [Clostridium bornimense]